MSVIETVALRIRYSGQLFMSTSWENVSSPRMAPYTVSLFREARGLPTISWYDSSTPSFSLAAPASAMTTSMPPRVAAMLVAAQHNRHELKCCAGTGGEW